ncbi:MAG: hypothetical protein ACI9UV_003231, partial [Algoriphagus sp.]
GISASITKLAGLPIWSSLGSKVKVHFGGFTNWA